MSVKQNKRVQQLANRNLKESSFNWEEAKKQLENVDTREMTACALWLCNPLEMAHDQESFEKLDQGEWVGTAVFVKAQTKAALSPWSLESAVMRPLNLTNTSLDEIRTGGERKGARIERIEIGEFNATIPIVRAGEHLGANRVSAAFLEKSTAGRQALSMAFCGAKELWQKEMAEAL